MVTPLDFMLLAPARSATSGLESTSATANIKIGYYDLDVIRQHCHELVAAEKLQSDAEGELSRDLDEGRRALARMRAQMRSAREVDAAASQIQSELNDKLHVLGARIKQNNDAVDKKVKRILEMVRKENGLDLLVERRAVDTANSPNLQNCKNVTDFVVTHLLSADVTPTAATVSRSRSEADPERLNINECQASFRDKSVSVESLEKLESAGIVLDEKTKMLRDRLSQTIALSFGNVLFLPGCDLRVCSKHCQLVIPKGAVICLLTNAYCTCILDFHDSALGPRPRVSAGGKTISLSPGTEVLIAGKASSGFASLNRDLKLSSSDLHVANLTDKGRLFVSKFSMTDAIKSIPMIQELLSSTGAVQKRAAYNVMKDAAILAN